LLLGLSLPEVPRLLLLRHGRTEWNEQGRFQGSTDIPLDAVGRAQAVEAGRAVATLKPAAVWSSDLSRAADTAAHIGLPVTLDARLQEISLGSFEGMMAGEWAAADPVSYEAWRLGADIRRGGGETYVEVSARAGAAVAEALAALPGGEGLLVVVCHGGTTRALLNSLLRLPAAPWAQIGPLGNCCCALLTDAADGRGWRLTAYGVPPQSLGGPADG
jgi:probable phosphoglycerate mutase